MPFVTCQRSAAAAKVLNQWFCRRRPPTRASVSFFRSKSAGETESTRPLHVLSGSVPQRAGAACTALRRRANRQDNTPLMHRRLALMLLASARALRPIASLRGGARTLRRASAAPTMSDTHRAASSTSEGLRDRRGFATQRRRRRDSELTGRDRRRHFDYLVIGAGSGGIASARRAATHGAARSVHTHEAIAAI